jgi:hypothetical protein
MWLQPIYYLYTVALAAIDRRVCFSITFDKDADREQAPGAVLRFQLPGKGYPPERYSYELFLREGGGSWIVFRKNYR